MYLMVKKTIKLNDLINLIIKVVENSQLECILNKTEEQLCKIANKNIINTNHCNLTKRIADKCKKASDTGKYR